MTLKNFSTDQLKKELEKRERESTCLDHLSPVGAWKVTTEGDVEGKTVKDLGVHVGHIVDIARALAKNTTYCLHFEKAQDPPPVEDGIIKTHISLDIKTGTWDMDLHSRKMALRRFLGKEPSNAEYEVNEGRYHASVELSTVVDYPF